MYKKTKINYQKYEKKTQYLNNRINIQIKTSKPKQIITNHII